MKSAKIELSVERTITKATEEARSMAQGYGAEAFSHPFFLAGSLREIAYT